MLEKKTYKFSKRGVEARNLTTGDKELVTLSNFGQQSSYEKKQQTYVGDHKKVNHSSSNERLMTAYNRGRQHNTNKSTPYDNGGSISNNDISAPSQSYGKAGEFARREAYINRSQSTDSLPSESTFSPGGQLKYNKDSFSPFKTKSRKRKEKVLKMQMTNRVARRNGNSRNNIASKKAGGSFAGKIVSSTATKVGNIITSELDKSDNVALQSISGSINAVNTGKEIAKAAADIAKTTAKTYRTAKELQVATRRMTRKITKKIQAKILAKKGIKTTVKTGKIGAKELAKKAKQILSNPNSWKVVLIAAVVIIVILLLTSFAQGILAAITGTTMEENADKATVQYIKNKDALLKQEILDIQANLLASGAVSAEFFGLERIDTKINPVLALLAVLNGGDTELTKKSMKILDDIHKKLNTYSIAEFSEVVSSPDGAIYVVTWYEIYVDAYTVLQRIEAFGLTDEQREMLLFLLEMQGEFDESSTGEGNPGDGTPGDGDDVPGGGNGTLFYPLGGHTNITSPYGERKDPITGKLGEFHPAIDISAPKGTPISAAADGTVSFSGVRGTYGNLIIIDHGGGMQTYYAHCDTLIVQQGATVSVGQQIATVGTTGRSTGPHLHFEVRINGRHQNPMSFF